MSYHSPVKGRMLLFELSALDDSCCEQMKFHINEKEKIIRYSAVTRLYAIHVRSNIVQQIYHCPWCGDKLPRELNEDWVIEVCKSLNVTEDEIYDLDDPDLPLEFKTDEWWKKRGL